MVTSAKKRRFFRVDTTGDGGREFMFLDTSIDGMREAFHFARGTRTARVVPPDPRIDIGREHRRGKLGAFLGNRDGQLVVSAALRRLIEKHCPTGEIEYVPFTLCDDRRKVVSREYAIVNPIGAVDVLDEEASLVERDEDGKVDHIGQLVLDPEKSRAAPQLFRLAQEPGIYVVGEALHDDIEAQGLTNVELDELKDASEVSAPDPSAVYDQLMDLADDDESERFGEAFRRHRPRIAGHLGDLLCELAKYGSIAACRILLAEGVPADLRSGVGELPLQVAAREGKIEVCRLLLDAGADPNAAADRFGNALGACCLTGWVQHLDVLRLLVERGASPTAVHDGSSALDRLIAEIERSSGPHFLELHSQLLEALDILLPFAGEQAARVEDALARHARRKREVQDRTAQEAKARRSRYDELAARSATAGWAREVKRLIQPLPAGQGGARDLCEHLLRRPECIANRSWPELIRKIVELSWTYPQVTKKVFGKARRAADMDEDESSALDLYADEHLYTFDLVLNVLAAEPAVAHEEWAGLVVHVCERKREAIRDQSFGDEEIAALLARPYVQAHPALDRVEAAARKAFPHARLGRG